MSHHKASFDADYGAYNGAWGDPRNDEEDGLSECQECDATGGTDDAPCPFCSGKAFFCGEEPMSKQEYDRFTEEMRYPT